ncbi:hypothetical protein MLD38_025585 [Melastoma candidum]|uniref:Uncharacterized protein n=1 Tax=Melastoma candidum TaxID=119954 RepID=A0ACB9NZA8_9MYRT|nr:hypothetical protein MLD38_025585 [Melastoma candidum]
MAPERRSRCWARVAGGGWARRHHGVGEIDEVRSCRGSGRGKAAGGGLRQRELAEMRSTGHGCHGGEGCRIGGVPGLSNFRDERGGWSGPLTAGGEEDSLPLALEEQDLLLPVAGGCRGSFRCWPPVARLDLKAAARKSRCRVVGGGPGRSVAGFERKLRGGRFVASATGCGFRSRREWMAAAGDAGKLSKHGCQGRLIETGKEVVSGRQVWGPVLKMLREDTREWIGRRREVGVVGARERERERGCTGAAGKNQMGLKNFLSGR